MTKDGGKTWSAAAATTGISQVHLFQHTVFRVRSKDPGNGTDSGLPGPPVLESAPLGSADFTESTLPWSKGMVLNGSIPAGAHAFYLEGVDETGDRQILRTVDGKHWQSWIAGLPCGPRQGAVSTVGALDGSLVYLCQDSSGKAAIRVAPNGSKTIGPPRSLPAARMTIAAAISATDFGGDGPAVGRARRNSIDRKRFRQHQHCGKAMEHAP